MKKLYLTIAFLLFSSNIQAAQQTLTPVDGTGNYMSGWEDKINAMFTELYASGGITLDATPTNGNTTSTVSSDGIFDALVLKADALTADQNYVSDAQLTVVSNTSGTNTGDQTATTVSVTATGFDGNLATTDDTVQKVAQKLDDLVAAGMAYPTSGNFGYTSDGINWATTMTLDTDLSSVSANDDSVPSAKAANAIYAKISGQTFTGPVIAPSFSSSADDGERFFEAINTIAIASTATLGRFGWYNGELRYADGTDWDGYFIRSDVIGSVVQAYDADTLVDAIEFVIDGGGSAITTG